MATTTTTTPSTIKNTNAAKKKLYMAIKNHRLSRLIHGTPSIIGYGRRTRERRRQCRRRRRHRKSDSLPQWFSGGGFTRYGKLDTDAKGWDEERIGRLLQRNIPEHELSLPNEPPPQLTVKYLSRHFSCLPYGLYKNLLKQTLDRRPQRIESYFIHQYEHVPPRVRRLLTGSYYGSFFKAHPEAHRLKDENEPLDDRDYRHQSGQPPNPPPPAAPPPIKFIITV